MQYTEFTALTIMLIGLTGCITAIYWFYCRFKIKTNDPLNSHSITYKIFNFIKTTFFMLLIIVSIRSFVFEPFQIPSGSMLPTLKVGDFVIVNRFIYGLRIPLLGHKIISVREPKRGEIIVFQFPKDTRIAYIKRLIGVPGDKIKYANNQLFINDELIQDAFFSKTRDAYDPQIGFSPWATLYEQKIDDYTFHIQRYPDLIQPSSEILEYTVPKDMYFVMGDNRDKSYDSRSWGFVQTRYLIGKAAYIWLHWPKSNTLPSIKRNQVIP
ncbi:MAG: signal peptidase I [Endozoicomonadaceae bacterium]|nr:signal peptidase I [Endozoicomonadaceae bacterium]